MHKFNWLGVIVVMMLAIAPYDVIAEEAVATPKSVQLSDKEREAVNGVQEKLNAVDTLVAHFSQLGYDGSFSEGTFFLKRPGRIRWQYAPPTPILIVGRGNSLTYYDSELEQISYVSLDDTLGNFLSRKTIDFFAKDVVITGVKLDAGLIIISLMQKERPEEGSLTLAFDAYARDLRTMEVTDAINQVTRVTFSDLRYGTALDDKLFYVPNPKYSGKN